METAIKIPQIKQTGSVLWDMNRRAQYVLPAHIKNIQEKITNEENTFEGRLHTREALREFKKEIENMLSYY